MLLGPRYDALEGAAERWASLVLEALLGEVNKAFHIQLNDRSSAIRVPVASSCCSASSSPTLQHSAAAALALLLAAAAAVYAPPRLSRLPTRPRARCHTCALANDGGGIIVVIATGVVGAVIAVAADAVAAATAVIALRVDGARSAAPLPRHSSTGCSARGVDDEVAHFDYLVDIIL